MSDYLLAVADQLDRQPPAPCQSCGSDLVMPTLRERHETACWDCGHVWIENDDR